MLFAVAGVVIALVAATVIAGGGREETVVGVGADERRGATVWAVGDGAVGSREAKRIARLVDPERTDWFLYLGDVYETGTRSEFRRNYATVYGRLDPITLPTLGDHETANRRQGYLPYWRKHGPLKPKPYRQVELAGWEIIALTYPGEVPYPGFERQLAWLERAVSEPGTCRLAFWHAPRYSAGLVHPDYAGAEPLWATLEGHAVITVHGDEHNYQRFEPRRGIVQFIAGGGGRELYAIDEADPRLAASEAGVHGALRLRLRPTVARYSYQSAEGAIHDRGAIKCDPLSG